jgi:hypothetical protein
MVTFGDSVIENCHQGIGLKHGFPLISETPFSKVIATFS